jgi:glycosyltransferase involved in cell wall biosynthesis
MLVGPPSTWIVIPAYNEGEIVAEVLQELLACNKPYRIVVVDDGSNDDTATVASSFPVHVLVHPDNLGQGAALATGIEYALWEGAKIVVTFDADGQMRPKDIDTLVEAVSIEGVDVVLGSRFLGSKPEGMSRVKKLVLKLATWYTKLTTGLKISDAHNGMRAFKADALRKIEITHDRMAHASEILSEISRKKIVYKEVPVAIRYTKYSKAKGQSVFNSINILFELFLKGKK